MIQIVGGDADRQFAKSELASRRFVPKARKLEITDRFDQHFVLVL